MFNENSADPVVPIEREFLLQDIADGDEVLDQRLNRFVAYLREFFWHLLRLRCKIRE